MSKTKLFLSSASKFWSLFWIIKMETGEKLIYILSVPFLLCEFQVCEEKGWPGLHVKGSAGLSASC